MFLSQPAGGPRLLPGPLCAPPRHAGAPVPAGARVRRRCEQSCCQHAAAAAAAGVAPARAGARAAARLAPLPVPLPLRPLHAACCLLRARRQAARCSAPLFCSVATRSRSCSLFLLSCGAGKGVVRGRAARPGGGSRAQHPAGAPRLSRRRGQGRAAGSHDPSPACMLWKPALQPFKPLSWRVYGVRREPCRCL